MIYNFYRLAGFAETHLVQTKRKAVNTFVL